MSNGKSCCSSGICPKGSLPAVFNISSKGKGSVINLGDTQAYVTGDPNWKTGLVLVHDIYGWGGHHRDIADLFAEGGYYVIMPDFFKGGENATEEAWNDGKPQEGAAFLQKFPWSVISPVFDLAINHLKSKGIQKVGTFGFCWGAWVCALASQDYSKVQAVVWYHPTLQADQLLFAGPTVPELGAKVRAPTLSLPSGDEPDYYTNGETMGKMTANGIDNHTYTFKGTHHGYMTRGAGSTTELGKSWKQVGGTDSLGSLLVIQRGLNMGLGWFAKYLDPAEDKPGVRNPKETACLSGCRIS